MTVCSMKEAWAVADKMFPTDYQISETSSQNAGYPVYRSTINFYDTICDLGDRLEVNIAGKSVNIWVTPSSGQWHGWAFTATNAAFS